MPFPLTRLAIRRILTLAIALTLALLTFGLLLPPDHAARSLVRWHWGGLTNLVRGRDESWIFQPPKHPFDYDKHVGLLIKTGYGTKDRVAAQMEAMGLKGTKQDIIVVGDFTATIEENDVKVEVIDVVGKLLEDESMTGIEYSPRVLQYKALFNALDAADHQTAKEISSKAGWQVDAMKFIPGLELAYKQAPERKWWIIIDDDTYLIRSSIEKVLSRVDPEKDHYIGNAVGDYKARFAHGGSAIVLSKRTLQHLFERPEVVRQAKIESLTETWGDRLIATTLLKLGVSLDERFTSYFSGEPARMVKATTDNFCLPIASLHGLGDPQRMRTTGSIFRATVGTVFWGQLWSLYEQPDIDTFATTPIRENHNHVGRLDSKLTAVIENVASAEDCVKACDTRSNTYLAWTYVHETKKCHLAPWVVIGDQEAVGKSSGIHFTRAKAIGLKCQNTMFAAGCFTEGGCSL